ncbi:MAG: helix-turn-helix transcriptional regulator, partial [Clostridia bacterium]|nr:helix-turn-helix transcriptional regulator [Clostridia bacterium]
KLNGTSPIDYIISKRIELSRSALKRTDDNILDIAKKYGFNNTANYNRAFKLKTGMTPSEFRKRSRSEDITDW